ncbi:MAG: stage II sporulation protein D [Eubacteriales bacterium]|nr:stage II sporulation protein D [Eubacteriales bacterium]
MIRRRRRLSVESIVFLAIIVFVLLAVIYPAVTVLIRHEQKSLEEIEIEIEQEKYVNVYIDGGVIEMPLEEYLVGVVAAEMPASYELEALKAQAVAARTYTLYKMNNGGCAAHEGADICTDSGHCQAYMTEEEMADFWGDDAGLYLEKIQTAVASTSGEVLYYKGEEIQVFYHACSGGQTENCENVYSQVLPYLVSVQSEGEEAYSNFYGEVAVSFKDFKSKMEAYSPSIDIDDVASCIEEIVRYESGRVESIEIGGEAFTGREIRGVFSLNSANFTIDISGDTITFNTVGYGHGVGMSQSGANAMAKGGASYVDILTHYYTGVTIE